MGYTTIQYPTAIQIANLFVEKGIRENVSVSPMKLQPLLFLSQGYVLAICKRPLFAEMFFVGETGPVIPSVFHAFKGFGVLDISLQYIGESCASPDFEPRTVNVINAVWKGYGQESAIKLSNMMHLPGTPWKEKYDETTGENGFLPEGVEIEISMIRKYFEAQLLIEEKAPSI